MANELTLKTVAELKDMSFCIPNYQRGYKWEPRHVTALLDDVEEFRLKKELAKDSFYCLQPLAVMQNADNYEVIDGQQRLTTIYLILQALGTKEEESFKIAYETRKDSACFLKAENDDYSNPDYFYISLARKEIEKWFSEKKNTIDKDKYKDCLLTQVKFIWYDLSEHGGLRQKWADFRAGVKDAQDFPEEAASQIAAWLKEKKEDRQAAMGHFDRLNTGKIPLNSAEIIKAALFQLLPEQVKEMALEWDSMERELRKDTFWGFLSNNPKPDTCISLLFELVLDAKDSEDNKSAQFDALQEELKKKDAASIWMEVKTAFYRLQHWFEDRELYHYVGYLVYSGKKLLEILKDAKTKSKADFKTHLKREIKETIKKLLEEKGEKQKKEPKTYRELEDLHYGDDSEAIKQILVLFNVLESLDNPYKTSYFPFYQFQFDDKGKKRKWSLEHVYAQQQKNKSFDKEEIDEICKNLDKLLKLNIEKGSLLESNIEKEPETKKSTWEEQVKEFRVALGAALENEEKIKDAEELQDLLNQLYNGYELVKKEKEPNAENTSGQAFWQKYSVNDNTKEEGYDLHSLANIVLLEQGQNSSLSNKLFEDKRETLLMGEKKYFIPAASLSAFLKQYNKGAKNLYFWDSSDQEAYLKAIKTRLQDFLPEETKEENILTTN